jgi:hypothetical protein
MAKKKNSKLSLEEKLELALKKAAQLQKQLEEAQGAAAKSDNEDVFQLSSSPSDSESDDDDVDSDAPAFSQLRANVSDAGPKTEPVSSPSESDDDDFDVPLGGQGTKASPIRMHGSDSDSLSPGGRLFDPRQNGEVQGVFPAKKNTMSVHRKVLLCLVFLSTDCVCLAASLCYEENDRTADRKRTPELRR